MLLSLIVQTRAVAFCNGSLQFNLTLKTVSTLSYFHCHRLCLQKKTLIVHPLSNTYDELLILSVSASEHPVKRKHRLGVWHSHFSKTRRRPVFYGVIYTLT